MISSLPKPSTINTLSASSIGTEHETAATSSNRTAAHGHRGDISTDMIAYETSGSFCTAAARNCGADGCTRNKRAGQQQQVAVSSPTPPKEDVTDCRCNTCNPHPFRVIVAHEPAEFTLITSADLFVAGCLRRTSIRRTYYTLPLQHTGWSVFLFNYSFKRITYILYHAYLLGPFSRVFLTKFL